jgi:hypothetical protein
VGLFVSPLPGVDPFQVLIVTKRLQLSIISMENRRYSIKPMNMVSVPASQLSPELVELLMRYQDFIDSSDMKEVILSIGTLTYINTLSDVSETLREEAMELYKQVTEYSSDNYEGTYNIPVYLFIMQ